MYRKFATLVADSFENDVSFVAALDKACRKIVNANAVTRRAKSTSKSPEQIARYCDMLLKSSARNPEERELESTLSSIMLIFKYLEDKDVFQKFYTRMLAKRLVNGTSASDDAEETMISKLREVRSFASQREGQGRVTVAANAARSHCGGARRRAATSTRPSCSACSRTCGCRWS